jgi:hypothetical protein
VTVTLLVSHSSPCVHVLFERLVNRNDLQLCILEKVTTWSLNSPTSGFRLVVWHLIHRAHKYRWWKRLQIQSVNYLPVGSNSARGMDKMYVHVFLYWAVLCR